MFVDPNDLSEEKFEKLVDLALDCFAENVSLLSDLDADPRLVKYITSTFSKSDITVMIDIPHPEWWPDHEMYAEASRLESDAEDTQTESEGDAPVSAGASDASDTAADAPADADDAGADADSPEFDSSLDDENNLANYIELSVVATPTDDNSEEEQVVLASILLPSFWIEEMDQPDADPSMLDALELQWLPERNTLDN